MQNEIKSTIIPGFSGYTLFENGLVKKENGDNVAIVDGKVGLKNDGTLPEYGSKGKINHWTISALNDIFYAAHPKIKPTNVESKEKTDIEIAIEKYNVDLKAWNEKEKPLAAQIKAFTDTIAAMELNEATKGIAETIKPQLVIAETKMAEFLAANPKPIKPEIATEAQIAELAKVKELGLTDSDYYEAKYIVSLFTKYVCRNMGITDANVTENVAARAGKDIDSKLVRSTYSELIAAGKKDKEARSEIKVKFGINGDVKNYLLGKIGYNVMPAGTVNEWMPEVWYGRDGVKRSGIDPSYKYSHIEKHTAGGIALTPEDVPALLDKERLHKESIKKA